MRKEGKLHTALGELLHSAVVSAQSLTHLLVAMAR